MSKRIVILGGGESGTGSAVLAQKNGEQVFLSDSGMIKPRYKELLNEYGIDWEEGTHSNSRIMMADEIIKSPGIPDNNSLIKDAISRNIPVISEIEYAGRYTNATKICITGSNGKTTTTSLIFHMLKKAGLNVAISGNVGNSFALQVATGNFDFYVIELSSFQLDGMYDFKADIAILLNITPDHLDRYNYNIQEYTDSKFRITRNLTSNEVFIYSADDEIVSREMSKRKFNTRLLPFSFQSIEGEGAWIENNLLNVRYANNQMHMIIDDLSLKGKHNAYNSMAAAIAGHVLKIRKETIRESLSDFQGVEHRLEPVLRIHGIDFINDSKATNVNSTWYALESMRQKVVWIVGGIDKGNDYSELAGLVRDKVKAIVCLGKDNSKIQAAFGDFVPTIVDTKSMKEAVRSAYYLAKNGDVVLLSPACASFDLFENYEDRGRQFKEQVRNL
jgi:UDP-N-acetylmuramoylalanine--D-glutamate ligase